MDLLLISISLYLQIFIENPTDIQKTQSPESDIYRLNDAIS